MILKYKVKAKCKGDRQPRLVYNGTNLAMMVITAGRMYQSDEVTDCEVTILNVSNCEIAYTRIK